MVDEEWTFVPHRKASKHRRHSRHNEAQHAPNTQKHAHGSGLYKASIGGGSKAGGIRCSSRTEAQPQGDDALGHIKSNVIECLAGLEDQLYAGNGFAHRLIASIMLVSASSCADDHDHETYDGDGESQGTTPARKLANVTNNERVTLMDCRLNLRDIVAYGIGNFATERFQAPMLQLACLLLVRRCAATGVCYTNQSSIKSDGSNTDEGNISDTRDATSSFEREQKLVPIYYYEPCILPAEKELLESTFHVHVLESNDMGKLTVESMRQPIHSSPASTAGSDSQRTHTLFYMPHCPMRLYCNVIWAHWDHILPAWIEQKNTLPTKCTTAAPGTNASNIVEDNNQILVFGNSFRAYEDRTISSEKRLDRTNGVFRIAPFSREIPVSGGNSKRNNRLHSGEVIPDALRHLEVAFNDCNVIYFPFQSDKSDMIGDGREVPGRPDEYFASEDTENSGELR